MKQCAGIWLPDHETHLIDFILRSPRVGGIGTYQFHKIELALGYVKDRRVAVDVGAHVGLISRILAMEFDQVVAFEPKPEHCACFRENVTAANVQLHEMALGASPGEVRLTTPNGNSGHTFVADHGEVIAEMRMLDSFGLEDVDFVKIDAEGYERDVLFGARDTLKRCKPTLMVEQKPNNGRKYNRDLDDYAALRFLERMGAQIVAKKAGDFILVWPDGHDARV